MKKLPADLNKKAKAIVDIVTGQTEKPKEKDPNAVALGKKGGGATAKKLTKEQRQELGRKGGLAKKTKPSA